MHFHCKRHWIFFYLHKIKIIIHEEKMIIKKAGIWGFILGMSLLGFIEAEAQKVFRSSDRWGSTKGDCIATVENGNVFRSSGVFCTQGDCAYIVEANKVFKSRGAFCTIKGNCQFVLDGNYFYETSDPFGNFVDALIFVIEGNRIYKPVNNFTRGACLYIIEDNKIYNSYNPSGSMKDDCIMIIEEGSIPITSLLAILARRF